MPQGVRAASSPTDPQRWRPHADELARLPAAMLATEYSDPSHKSCMEVLGCANLRAFTMRFTDGYEQGGQQALDCKNYASMRLRHPAERTYMHHRLLSFLWHPNNMLALLCFLCGCGTHRAPSSGAAMPVGRRLLLPSADTRKGWHWAAAGRGPGGLRPILQQGKAPSCVKTPS